MPGPSIAGIRARLRARSSHFAFPFATHPTTSRRSSIIAYAEYHIHSFLHRIGVAPTTYYFRSGVNQRLAFTQIGGLVSSIIPAVSLHDDYVRTAHHALRRCNSSPFFRLSLPFRSWEAPVPSPLLLFSSALYRLAAVGCAPHFSIIAHPRHAQPPFG